MPKKKNAKYFTPHCWLQRYVRSVESWNPSTRMCSWHIDFFDNDGERHRGFTYLWRVWAVAEVTRCLEAAGFEPPRILYTPAGSDMDVATVAAPSNPKAVDSNSTSAAAPAEPHNSLDELDDWYAYVLAHKPAQQKPADPGQAGYAD